MNNTNNIRDKNRTIIITNQLTQQFIDNQTQEWKKYLLRCMRSLGTFTRNQFMKNQIKVEPALIDSLMRALSLLAEKSNSVNALQEIIDSGYDVSPVIVDGDWCEIDTPQDLEKVEKSSMFN